jgi:chemotaxis protein methyltransferase CheR
MMMTLENFSANGVLPLTEKEFHQISSLVYEKFGINLTDKKRALVRGRLNKLVRSLGFSSFGEYYTEVIQDRTGVQLLHLIDRISTNHSFFFREADHFEFFTQSVLPKICRRLEGEGSRDIRIWCAGCAQGEEPYTIAMVLKEHFGAEIKRWDIGILATDISISSLSEAITGVYPIEKTKAVPLSYRKYFLQQGPDRVAVKSSIKDLILFKRLNLMRDVFPFRGKFHVVFCRNVMIYFDQETRMKLFAKLHRLMHEAAYLFLGHSETIRDKTDLFRYVRPTVYEKCRRR